LVPLICYFSSVLAASKLSWFYENVGRKKALMSGTFICVLCMTVVYFLIVDFGWVIYFLAFFIGISQAMVLGTGINLISEVVG
jgi:MFS family permease